MGTKLNPGPFDCYQAALPDEPLFILLARDETAPGRIRDWVTAKRAALIAARMASPDIDVESDAGKALTEDLKKCSNAEIIAHEMEIWRAENYGAWRTGFRKPHREIDPALRDLIEQAVYRGVCQSLMAGTQQVVLGTHEVRNWSVRGFNVRDHVFRFESASGVFAPVLAGDREIEFPDWYIGGFDAHIGDVRTRAESENVLHVALQIVGD